MTPKRNRIYSVKETYLTVQGEGAQTGRPAVFLRFAGCNLWTGREKDRAKAICKFCDTQFVGTDGPGGGQFKTPQDLAAHVISFWPDGGGGEPWVVCTGGEPLLQLGTPLIDALHAAGLKIAVESNGTVAAPAGIDWLTVSPKANAPLIQKTGDELKLVYPQTENSPQDFAALDFKNFYLQPRDDTLTDPTQNAAHAKAAFEYCLKRPQWKLSIQTHKFIGVP